MGGWEEMRQGWQPLLDRCYVCAEETTMTQTDLSLPGWAPSVMQT